MDFAHLSALMLFAATSSITPGPNNLMILNSGVNFGLRATLPLLSGVVVGFFLILLLVGLGLGQVFSHFPIAYQILKVLGTGYLLYLAWKIAHSSAPANLDSKPARSGIGFWGAIAFQWVNPKAWMMTISTFSTYVPANSQLSTIVLAAMTFSCVGAPCIASWAVLGSRMRHYLQNPIYLKRFNFVMAGLLVLSLIPFF